MSRRPKSQPTVALRIGWHEAWIAPIFAIRISCLILTFCCFGSLPLFGEEIAEQAFIQKIVVMRYGHESIEPPDHEAVWIDPCLDLPGSSQELKSVLAPYLCLNRISKQDLREIEEQILQYYREHHRPIVSIVIPPQEMRSGYLRVYVVEPVISDVCFEGNSWISDATLQKRTGIHQNETLNSYNLQKKLAWINRTPFRQTNAVLSPGKQPGSTDILLVTKDRFPLRIYAGVDNTGTTYLQSTRWYTGFNAGSLWGIDHQASFQFTAAKSPHTLKAFAGQYLAPLPWYHTLLVYGGYTTFDGKIPAPEMNQKGKNWQVSGRYQIPFSPIFGNFLQQISFGYDFKRTNNELLFGGISFTSGFADTNQFYLGYLLDFTNSIVKTSLSAEIWASPWKMTKDQSVSAYERLRPFAKPEYVYGRCRISSTFFLPRGFLCRNVFAAQATGWNLLPSEQFGLGGFETVRGYDERAFNVDSGLMASVEFVSPSLGFVGKEKEKQDALEFLAFADFGYGTLHHAAFGQKKSDWLMGVGPGARYRFRTNVVLRGDIGFPLHQAGIGRHGIHGYGSATVSY